MNVLGISAFYHDSAAALVKDGEIVAAAQEERFNRIKHYSEFPSLAAAYCLNEGGLALDDIDYIGFYDKPLLTFNRLLETYLAFAPRGLGSFVQAIPVWVKEKIFQKGLILKELKALGLGAVEEKQILFGHHHHSHAASAFYPSPFERAAILVMDGVGEWATTTLGEGNGPDINLAKEIRFPHSLGMLYSAFTYYLGFAVNDGEYKVMGLAPYGVPKYTSLILDNLIDVKDDFSFRLNMDYFNYCTGLTMTNARFDALFGAPRHAPEAPLGQREMDLAASIQKVTEEIVLKLVSALHRDTGQKNLCLAGGVALNCVANGRILREGPFENIWIQPAAGDAGASVGVALTIARTLGHAEKSPANSTGDAMKGTYLGPAFGQEEILPVLERYNANYSEVADDKLQTDIARYLAAGKVIGWFQGRMEFGPRALGNRSILADARSESLQRVLNLKIKYRESFRPFAPAVLAGDAGQYFDLDEDSPYMLLVAPVEKSRRKAISDADNERIGLDKLNVVRSEIPAVTHVDYSARVQTVHQDTNPKLHSLITEFKKLTGCPVLVNTSFNVRDEPIVCSPEDAYRCFMGTEMDVLVLENIVLLKEDQ